MQNEKFMKTKMKQQHEQRKINRDQVPTEHSDAISSEQHKGFWAESIPFARGTYVNLMFCRKLR